MISEDYLIPLREQQVGEPFSECHELAFNRWLGKNFISSTSVFSLVTNVVLNDYTELKTNSKEYESWWFKKRREYIYTHIYS